MVEEIGVSEPDSIGPAGPRDPSPVPLRVCMAVMLRKRLVRANIAHLGTAAHISAVFRHPVGKLEIKVYQAGRDS
jgi:hypothetical protein